MASEWDKFRDEIVLLYLVEGLTLNKVSSRMIQKHGFNKKCVRVVLVQLQSLLTCL